MISLDTGMSHTFPRSNVSSEYIPSPIPSENSREMLATHGAVTPDVDSLVSGGGAEPVTEYGQCQMKGMLYKKRDRFSTWTKMYCTIRNNFLECHKSSGDHYTPALKLFLPGSEVKEGGGDAKKKWALQVSGDCIVMSMKYLVCCICICKCTCTMWSCVITLSPLSLSLSLTTGQASQT